MKILALDTATEYCSVALWLDGECVASGRDAGREHSEILLPMIDALMSGAGLGLKALDAIAYGMGPGSFTGLRIACGVTQGLAFGADLPVIGIGTLLAMAEASDSDAVACCLDARMSEIYHAVYERGGDGDWVERVAPGLYSPRALPPLAKGVWTGCGNAFVTYRDELADALGDALTTIKPGIMSHARQIAALAARELARGGGRGADQALPVYIRDKVALTIEEQR